jgi:DNA helicase-2/ATP-dependent DNA helicase PcrA
VPSTADDIDDESGTVSLMTLHTAKGLEYDVVFLTGIEEGLLPHKMSFMVPGGTAEERRLFYVGITRAKKRLHLIGEKDEKGSVLARLWHAVGDQFPAPTVVAPSAPTQTPARPTSAPPRPPPARLRWHTFAPAPGHADRRRKSDPPEYTPGPP